MNIIYILYNSDSNVFFLDQNKTKEHNIDTPCAYTIKVPEKTLPDLDKLHKLIKKDILENCAIKIERTNDIISLGTVPYNNEQNYRFVVDVTEYAFRKEKPNAYLVRKEMLVGDFIKDIRAHSIYAKYSLQRKL